MGKIRWIIFGAIVVLVLGGLIVYSRVSNPPIDVTNVDTNSIVTAGQQNGNIADHVYGKTTDPKVVLVEYGDFQCPSCKGAFAPLQSLKEEYKDDLTFIFRNFPLTTIHPNARAAAAVAEAAGLQGKFWEMHDMLFSSQNSWSTLTGQARTEQFKTYAVNIGIDADKFMTDVASSGVNQKISFDQALGKKVGVSATPTFFLNGEKVNEEASNALVQGDPTAIKALIDAQL